MSRIQLDIDSDLGNVVLVALAVNRICLHVGMDSTKAAMVELGVTEALTNAIQHACQGRTGSVVSLLLSTFPDRLEIEVIDRGIGIPADQVRKLLHGSPELNLDIGDLESLSESGRGLQIIHDVMDQVVYIQNEDRNSLRLTKQIHRSTS